MMIFEMFHQSVLNAHNLLILFGTYFGSFIEKQTMTTETMQVLVK